MSITGRIDRITEVRDPAPRMPAPRSVKVELTGRCNYRCGFCALRTRDQQPQRDLDLGLFRRLAREMREAGVEELGLFYLGESFTRPRLLLEALAFAKRECGFPYVFLTTNGSLATPTIVRACMAAGLDSLKFSVNAADDEQFSHVMAVDPRLFRRALANLKGAREVRDAGQYACRLYASSIQFDGAQQARMEALVAEHVRPYVDEHYWLPLYSMGAFASLREAELGYRPIAGNQGRIGALRPPLPCWSCFTEAHVTSAGLLSACCFDANGRWVMADLNTVGFLEGWNSAPFQALRAAHIAEDVTGTICQECLAYA